MEEILYIFHMIRLKRICPSCFLHHPLLLARQLLRLVR